MKVFKPLDTIFSGYKKSIFLAGSIDSYNAANWRNEVITSLSNTNYEIYNPERIDWDESWENSQNDKQFNQQTNWELDAMQQSQIIIINFLPGTNSSISLLELGLFAHSKKLMVCCTEQFSKYGNVQIICDRYGIPFFKTIKDLLNHIN